MTRLALFALLLAGCGEEAGEGFPINPGGGGGGSGGVTRTDAAVDAGDAITMITGRVCVLAANLRTLSSTGCASTGADNLTVTLGTASAVTAADGTFTLMPPADTAGLHWTVTDAASGADVVQSLVKLGTTFGSGSATLLPAFDTAAYLQMVAANNASSDDAGIVVRVTKAGAVVAGATVTTVPAAASEVYYDADTDGTWDIGAGGTGVNGVAWIPSIAGTSAQLTVTSGTTQATVTGVQLAQGAITFVAAEIP